MMGSDSKIIYLSKSNKKFRSKRVPPLKTKILQFPRKYQIEAVTEWTIPGAKPPKGWIGTWTHQDPYLTVDPEKPKDPT